MCHIVRLEGSLVLLRTSKVLAQHQHCDDYPKPVRMLSQIAINPLIRYLRRCGALRRVKPDLLNMYIDSETALDWLDHSRLNHQGATQHPTAEAHEIWANYLLTFVE